MILEEILFHKRQEVTSLKIKLALDQIKGLPRPRNFLKAAKKGKFHLIAEIKKASPSAGVIREDFDPVELAKIYEKAGACAISILTDEKFFQGKLDYIPSVKKVTRIPILRKDFIIDTCQIYESRLAGADAVLLIARILTDEELKKLIRLTKKLKMTPFLEIHNEEEAQRVLKIDAPLIGINNRDLDSLSVDLQTTIRLLKSFPQLKKRIVISESGISTAQEINILKNSGIDGVLVGEAILCSRDIQNKINELKGNL